MARFSWPFTNRKRASSEAPSLADDQPVGLTDISHAGMSWRPTFERQRMPDPGAQNYSYCTYALLPQTVIGTGFVPRAHINACQGGMFGQPLVKITGLGGIQTGQLYGQPLYDPSTGQRGGIIAPPYGNAVR
mgnify:CR=1 FL=1